MSLEQVEGGEGVVVAAIKSWDDIPDLPAEILRGIFAYGFEAPSPIQQKTIGPLIARRDVVAQAQSGTGKTGAFAVGALAAVDLDENSTQVLILSPTKELTIQTARVVSELGRMMDGLRVKVMYGGIPIVQEMQQPHIVCGCPGRVYDMMTKGIIQASKLKMIILDEADELLSVKNLGASRGGEGALEVMGFKEQIYNIFQLLNEAVQVALFTATMPAYMDGLISKMMRNPLIIKVEPDKLTLEGITQYYVPVYGDMDKVNCLRDIYNRCTISQSIIYCNSVKRVMNLFNELQKDGFPICCIHSNMEKHVRDQAFTDFVSGKYRILISTDLTARGVDVQQVSLVFNFDIPDSEFTYLHRIGRGGRWGRKGVGINLVTQRDTERLRRIEGYYRCDIKALPVDFGPSLCR